MNLFELATRGVDLDALPAGRSPERESAVSAPVEFAVPQDLNAAFDAAADEYGVDADVLRAMAYAESRFRPDVMAGQVKSRTGATGLMQFMPETAKRFGIDPTDPVESIFGAAAYMRANLEKFDGDYDKAVAAYNWGENRQAYGRPDWKDQLPQETRGYLGTVFGVADGLKAKAPAQESAAKPLPPVSQPKAQAEILTEAPVIPERSWGQAVGDTTKSLAQGLLDVASLPGVAYSAITGDYDTGYLNAIKGTQDVLQEQKSPEIQARNQALQAKLKTAEGWREKLAVGGIETLKDPTLLADTLLRSAPGMAAGGLAGRAAGALAGQVGNAAMSQGLVRGAETLLKAGVAAKNAAPIVASAAAVGTSAATQGASVAKETFDELMKLPSQAFSAEEGFAQLVNEHGEDGAKAIVASAAANRALAVATATSVASMKLVPGGDAIEKLFLPASLKGSAREAAKAASSNALSKPLTQGMQGGLLSKAAELLVQGAKTGGMESISEGLEESTGAMAKGLELSRAGQRINLGNAMGEAGGQGMAAGLAMGKVAGMQSAYADSAPTVESQPKTPTVPPVSPSPVAPPVQPQAPTADDLPAQILQAEQTKDAESLPTVEQRDTGTVMLRGGDVAAVSQQLQDAGIEHARIPGGILVGATGAQAAAQMFAPPTETQPNAPTPANPGEETTPAPSAQGAPEAAVVLQNRNRSTPSSVAQMRSIAANPDYGRLGFSRDFANGAPVVAGGAIPAAQLGRQDTATASNGRRIPVQYAVVDAADVLTSNRVDGSPNVEYGNEQVQAVRAVAGNGRIAGLQAAYQANQAAQYTQELTQDSALHGIDPRVIAAMKNPVLVRVMPHSEITADIGDLSNTTGNLNLSAVEQANNDANRVDLAALQFSEDGSLTTEAVRQFVRAMPQAEQGGLIDTTGQPSKQAIDRLQAAVFAKAYGNEQLIRLFAQAQDPEARNILSALSQVANKMARLEGAGALDIRDVVAQAAEIAVNAKREGKAMAIAAQQMDMAADPDVSVVLDLFASNMRRVKAIVEALGNAADFAYTEANKPDADMFGEVPRASRTDILNTLRPENERGSQEALENAAGREPVAVDAVGQANEPAGSAALAEAQASRPAEDAANPEGLTSYTAEDIAQRQDERATAEATAKRADADAERAASAARQSNEIAQRSVAAADSFELGQSGEDNLSGQVGLNFSRGTTTGMPETKAPGPQGDAQGMKPQATRSPISTIAQAITKAYGKLLGQLESKGLVTLTQTLDQAIEAAAQARAAKTGQSVEQARAALRASVKNSVADQTQTENFQRWFKDSKAVDAEGKPLVVYHGTNAKFDVFDLSKFGLTDNGWYGKGFYFADDSAVAKRYGKRLIGVYLSLRNPMSADRTGFGEADLQKIIDSVKEVDPRFQPEDWLAADATFENSALSQLERLYTAGAKPELVLSALTQVTGFDGVAMGADGSRVYVAFNPTQIKSATGNNGDFDPANPDIRRSEDGAIQGFFDPQTGQSFLIADNLTAETAPGVFMHEVGIHMANDGTLQPLFDRASAMVTEPTDPFLQRVKDRMDAAGETSGEEAAAYIVEAYENDRANAPSSVVQWVKDFIADVRAWLFSKGVLVKGSDLQPADIAAIARAHARALANGAPVGKATPYGPGYATLKGDVTYDVPTTDGKTVTITTDDGIQRDKQGMPVIEGDGVTLQYGQPTDRLEFIPTDDSHQMLRFAVSTDANPFAGYVDALFQDGKPVALYDIFMEPDQRKGGSATKAVKALLDASPDGKLDISNIVTEAQEFWAKMGIPTQPNQPKGYAYDGTITQESFAASDAGKNAGTTRSDLPRGSGVRQAQDGRGRAGRSEESRAGTDGIEVSELTWEQAQAQGLKFSKKQAQQQALDLATPQWQLPDATKTDRLIYELQDGRIDLKRAQEAIAKAGRTITEGFDARLAETLMPGRVAYRTETFLKVEVQPLLEAMARNKVSQDELSDYLLARHAPERNAQISKINPDMPDGGAGTNSQGVLMTTQAARDHIAGLTSGKRTALELLARQVDALTQGTREMLVREGLEKQETIDAWTGAYQHYVPLFKDEAMETPGHPIGSGFSVTGSASKRSTGSSGEVTNMVAHILMQREAAITRAEKNRVAMSLYGLALTHPNAQMWTTVRPSMSDAQIEAELQRMGVDPVEAQSGMQGAPTIRAVDPVTGLVVDRPNPLYKRMDNALVVKVNGEDRVILFNKANPRALRMVQNLKNQDGVIGLDMAGSVVGRATRYLAAINTQYNPAFGMVNIVRDLGGAMVNLTDTPLAGKQARVLGDSIAAMQGIARDLRGDSKRTPWSDLWKQFQEDGGRTGYRDLFIDPYKRAESVQGDLDKLSKAGKLTPGAAAHAVLDLLDDFNTTLENGVRLSAYKAALDMGMSRSAAARVARELTLDFNRKGRTGRELGPLYAFFNASIQGTARTVQALKGPAGKRILAGGLSLGVVQALMLAAAGFDDDEIPEFIKARAFIIPMPGKQYIAIPLQFGLNALPNTGRVVTELLMSGGREWQEKTFDAVGELAGSFNPMGGGNIFTASGALKTIAPTVLDPLIEMGTNTGFSGQPIAKERMPWDTRPGFTMGRESTQRAVTGQVYVGISQAINRLTFGDDYTRGLASPAPEHVRYVFTTVGGGVFRELEKALSAAVLTAKGEDLKAREVPLGSRFAGEVDDEQVQRSRYYKNHARMEKLEAKLKGLAKDGKGEELRQFVLDEPAVKLYEANNQVASELAKLNKLAVENITDKEALKRIDAARTNTMRVLNDKVREMEKR